MALSELSSINGLEQYEDVLNNLTTSPPDYTAKTELPVKYLYRPEEQQIRLTMNMRTPFSNRMKYGKDNRKDFVDVLETYCYLQGTLSPAAFAV